MQVLPDGRQLGPAKGQDPLGVIVPGPGARNPAVPDSGVPGTGQELHRNRTDPDAIAGVQTVQFRKGEKSSPDAPPPEKPHRSSSTSLAIFLALVSFMALIILVLMM